MQATIQQIDVVPILSWMIITIGAALLGLLIWVGNRLQTRIDELPVQVSEQVKQVHGELVVQMEKMNATHALLEHDVRGQITSLDRRVILLEVREDLYHGNKS